MRCLCSATQISTIVPRPGADVPPRHERSGQAPCPIYPPANRGTRRGRTRSLVHDRPRYIGSSARNADEWDRLAVALGAFRRIDVEAHHFDRAHQVQRNLAADGLKGRKIPDLLVAAAAEAAALTVLHYDADFDHIAAVTGQPTEWIVERGSID
ncbi:MAG: PIN domain-containing protein [Microthrixaceae bacterium]